MDDRVSGQRSSQRSTQIVVATSAEPSAQVVGNADRRYGFLHRINQLNLPQQEEWSVGLARVSFYSPANAQVFISCNVVAPSRVGSQVVTELFHIPLTQTTAGLFQLEVTNILFRPVSTSTITFLQIQLTDQQGNPIPPPPVPATDPDTYVTLFFRRGDVL